MRSSTSGSDSDRDCVQMTGDGNLDGSDEPFHESGDGDFDYGEVNLSDPSEEGEEDSCEEEECEDSSEIGEEEDSGEEDEEMSTNSEDEIEVEGRRIMDVVTFFNQIKRVSRHNRGRCSFNELKIVKEVRIGFH